jgi:hypothetical protein
MSHEYVKTRVTEHGTQYSPACHVCEFGGPWTWCKDGAELNASFHKYAHTDEGKLW